MEDNGMISLRLEKLAAEINVIKIQVEKTALIGAIEIGKRLKEAKSQVPYGKWGEWLEAHVEYSERKAQDFMALAEGYGRQDPQAIADLSPTKALYLLALPGDERAEFMAHEDVEGLTTRELKARVDELVAEKAKLQLSMDEMLAAAQEHADDRLEEEKKKAAALADKVQSAKDKAEQLRVDNARLEARQEESDKEIERLKKSRQSMQKDLEAAEKEAARLQEELERAGQPIIQQVTPPEVTRELEQLRAEKINTAAVAKFRAGFASLQTAVESMVEALESMQGTDKAKYAQAVAKTLEKIRGKVESA